MLDWLVELLVALILFVAAPDPSPYADYQQVDVPPKGGSCAAPDDQYTGYQWVDDPSQADPCVAITYLLEDQATPPAG